MTTFLLVRHAATEWTALRRLQGRTDIDLSDEGRLEAARLRPLVDAWAPARVITSPLSRARSTAAILSDLPAEVVDEWTEASLGDWEGSTPDALGADYVRWRAGALVPPRGEARGAVRDRVRAAIGSAHGDDPVLVVTHGGTIRAVLAQCIGLSADRIDPVAAPSLTVLDIGNDGSGRLRLFNADAAGVVSPV